jgi:antitoxin HicB
MTDSVRRYPINLFWSDEDEGFIATAPDLPGCSAFGATKGEAVTAIERAIEAWMEAARAAGNPIPEASRPAIEGQPSGRLLLRMPKALHAGLIQAAKREAVSLNQYVVFLLAMAVTRRTVESWLWASHSELPVRVFQQWAEKVSLTTLGAPTVVHGRTPRISERIVVTPVQQRAGGVALFRGGMVISDG